MNDNNGANLRFKMFKHYQKNTKLLLIILTPILASIIPILSKSNEANCAFILVVMSVYWITECVPIALTSIIPIFLFPLFGLMKSKTVSPIYFKDNVMFIFSSVVIGLGIETTGLHQKIALTVCMLVGSDPKWILLGIMSVTAFLSIWISNTACATMILPIVLSIVKEVVNLDPAYSDSDPEIARIKTADNDPTEINITENPINEENYDTNSLNIPQVDEYKTPICRKKSYFKTKASLNLIKCFYLSIAYSATIGGTGSLIGTSSNIVFKGYFEDKHPKDSMNFLTYMLYSVPITIILTFLSWIVLCLIWLPKGKFISINSDSQTSINQDKRDRIRLAIKHKYDSLGSINWEQISILIWFIIVVVLWLTRDLYYIDGWSSFFEDGYVTDTTAAMLVLFFSASWPKHNIFKGEPYTPLLTWEKISELCKWNVIFLVGGSLALAEACDKSGLSKLFGDLLKDVLPAHKELSLLVIIIFTSIGTEILSNVSMISILLPILDTLAKDNNLCHHYLLLPQAISVNFSYMFASASPANAVVYGDGILSMKDMIISGFILKLIGIVVLYIMSNTWLLFIFTSAKGYSGSNSNLTDYMINNYTSTVSQLSI